MGGVERDMVGWMPIFRSNFEDEGKVEEGIEGRGDVSASGDGERARL